MRASFDILEQWASFVSAIRSVGVHHSACRPIPFINPVSLVTLIYLSACVFYRNTTSDERLLHCLIVYCWTYRLQWVFADTETCNIRISNRLYIIIVHDVFTTFSESSLHRYIWRARTSARRRIHIDGVAVSRKYTHRGGGGGNLTWRKLKFSVFWAETANR